MEKKENQLNFTDAGKKFILNKLIQAEGFEKFLAVKFVGTKRYGCLLYTSDAADE